MTPRTSTRARAGLKKEPELKVGKEEEDPFRTLHILDSPIKRGDDEEKIFRPPLSFDSSEDEGDILDPPEDPGLSSSEEERDRRKAHIASGFGRASEEPKTQISNGRAVTGRGRGRGKGNPLAYGNSSTRAAGKKLPMDFSLTSSPKRKSQEDPAPLGTKMLDDWGRINTGSNKNKKAKFVYGSSQSRKASSQATVPKSTPDTSESPDRGFKPPPVIQNFRQSDEEEEGGSFQAPDISVLTDSNSSPPRPGFRAGQVPKTSNRSVRKLRADPLVSRLLQEDHKSNPPFRVLGLDGSLDNPLKSPKKFDIPPNDIQATQREPFKIFDIGALAGEVNDDSDDDADKLDLDSTILPDHVATQTQQAVCPMCEQPVDPDKLKAYGTMNTRMQEKFCRQHQKNTAEKEWEFKGYPDIDWNNMDLRISSHHKFIRKLINGADSHYRQVLSDKVDAGKDRSLMKMTSNLTPGYYGSRGLQAISENIMQKFTPLLKKRIVKDRLMSARGFTGYVQAVLVPEVAVLLIMEDMAIDIEAARKVLTESAGVGELLQEELRDIARRIENSEDELAD